MLAYTSESAVDVLSGLEEELDVSIRSLVEQDRGWREYAYQIFDTPRGYGYIAVRGPKDGFLSKPTVPMFFEDPNFESSSEVHHLLKSSHAHNGIATCTPEIQYVIERLRGNVPNLSVQVGGPSPADRTVIALLPDRAHSITCGT